MNCMARNAEEFFGGFDAQIRENEVHVRIEVVQRIIQAFTLERLFISPLMLRKIFENQKLREYFLQ